MLALRRLRQGDGEGWGHGSVVPNVQNVLVGEAPQPSSAATGLCRILREVDISGSKTKTSQVTERPTEAKFSIKINSLITIIMQIYANGTTIKRLQMSSRENIPGLG